MSLPPSPRGDEGPRWCVQVDQSICLRRRGPMIRRVLPPFIALAAAASLLVACARDQQQQQQPQYPPGQQPYGAQPQPYGQPAPTAYGQPPPAATPAPAATTASPFPFPIPAGFPTAMPSGFPALPGFPPAAPPAQLAPRRERSFGRARVRRDHAPRLRPRSAGSRVFGLRQAAPGCHRQQRTPPPLGSTLPLGVPPPTVQVVLTTSRLLSTKCHFSGKTDVELR